MPPRRRCARGTWRLCLALSGLLPLAAAHAGDPAQEAARQAARQRAIVEAAAARDQFGRPLAAGLRQPALARALEQAGKPDFAETNLQAWSEVLLKCQQATNPAWTTALLRSEAQQAHCYRY